MIEIKKVEGFCPTANCAHILDDLFSLQSLWENRGDLSPPYRNGRMYTLGASMYLDFPKNLDRAQGFIDKTAYFNFILKSHFGVMYEQFLIEFNRQFLGEHMEAKYLADTIVKAPLPGFHIFEPHATLSVPFGRVHKDVQWEGLKHLGVNADESEHFSFTLPLVLPYQGGGLWIPKDEEEELPSEFYFYEEGNLYVHSGQFPHQILPYKAPVLPMDWRITFQGHGFMEDNKAYLYW